MNTSEKKNPKILVIRFSSLGDVVLTTAIYPNLKAHWPESHITVVTKRSFVSVFDNNPHVDSVHYIDQEKQKFFDLSKELRQESFDIIIDLHNNMRSWLIRLVANAPVTVTVEKINWARRKLVLFKKDSQKLKKSFRERVLDVLKTLEVPVADDNTHLYPHEVDQKIEGAGLTSDKKWIGIAPGSIHATKRWTIDGFAEAANKLGEKTGAEIILLGDKSDKPVALELAQKILVPFKDLVGWTSLVELHAILSRMSLLLTNDSGLMHMGEALAVPTVSLFGPTVKGFGFAPYRGTSRVVENNNLTCRPCSLHGDEECPMKHHQCMKDINPDEVVNAAIDLLKTEKVNV